MKYTKINIMYFNYNISVANYDFEILKKVWLNTVIILTGRQE